MIQLDTETASNQNIYAGAVTALTHTLPASPVEHLVAANVQVSALAASVSRALTIRLLADAQEVFKADVLFTSGSATADKVRWLAVPPLPLRGGQVITITIQSDNASDTAVTLTAYLPSHDLDYILAFRAAEASPTADSPIERLKALDDGTAVVGAKLADVAHGGAAATLTLQTPVEANAVQINSSVLAAQVLAAEKYSYRADAVVLVADGVNDAARGVNLAAAYTAAKALTPGGAALSAMNRACVLIPPARYSLAATLVADGKFVDFAGLGDQPEDTEIYAVMDDSTVEQTANDIRMRNLAIRISGTMVGYEFKINAANNSASIYEDMYFSNRGVFGTSDIKGTWRRCKADGYSWRLAANKVLAATMFDCEGGDLSFGGDNAGVGITGRLERCRAGIRSFGGCTNFGCYISGTLIDCEAGVESFAVGKNFSGVAIRCRGGDSSFGATTVPSHPGTFSGYAEDCVAGKGSFGGRGASAGTNGKCTGTLVRCMGRGSELGMRLEGATLEGCLLTTAATGEHGVVLLNSASRIIDSTILVVEGDTGIPINDDGSARSVASAGNRFNNLGAAPLGLGPNVTNKGLLDKIDATVGSRAAPSDVTTAHATTDGLIGGLGSPEQVGAVAAAHATTDGLIAGLGSPEQAGAAAAAAGEIRGGTRTLQDLATPADVRTTVIPGTLQVRAGTFTLQGASQQTLDLPAGYASTLPLRLVDADENPVDLSETDLVLRAVKADGEDLFVLAEGDGITKTEDGQFTIAISAEQAEAGRHKYELGDAGAKTLYAKGDLVFRVTFGLEAES